MLIIQQVKTVASTKYFKLRRQRYD